MPVPHKILVLAGTREARKLIERLALMSEYEVIASLAGVTKHPADLGENTRVGGFGGPNGLADYLQAQGIAAVVDATHPYAAQISRNAVEATECSETLLLGFERAPWEKTSGDIWHQVKCVEAALELIPTKAKVFFAAGTKVAAPLKQRPDITFIIRTLNAPTDAVAMPNAQYIEGLPNADWRAEYELLKKQNVDWVISKNSGGTASYGKIRAARELGLPVAMIKRPENPCSIQCASIDAVLAKLQAILN
ncbi:cobalt-precorrin-6A/precorrin-6x reductase [Pseudovibrio japonicus]|uniref:Cobalt-precorrin-6A/precorrin-6x reductase n=1 Tax=Pseudovibrio japonicus TaxID=366534 RepID=A0ABQ3E3S0_9HYPH|nr:cobalt-precorrin-6A reductase [Pseudovibrio japonicus]GHB23978.1 cobalt-precorrin-6A/precorrin-6x reductase [Pseudovibrio japonicus]